MIPSKTWFPGTLQDRAAWYDNFNTVIQLIGLTLGLLAADLDAIKLDNAMVQFLASSATTVDAYADAVRTFRRVLTEGNIGDATPDFPAAINPAVATAVPTGIWERLDDWVKRIRVAAAYTEETGAALGIVPKGSGPSLPTVEHMKLDASSLPGNVVEVKFVRGKSDGVLIETAIDNDPFGNDRNYPKSPAVIVVPQNADHLPRSVRIRARYLSGNSPIGDWSDVVTVQTIP